jgi:site-specific recombinase XerD
MTAFRSWAKANGNPTFLGGYRLPTPPRPAPHLVDGGLDTVRGMIHSADEAHHRALLALCGLAGLRVGEATTVTCDDFDANARLMTVRGKGDKTRIVPVSMEAGCFVMPAFLLAMVRKLDGGDSRIVPLHTGSARKFVGRAGLAEGVHIASHDLRAQFATTVYEKTLDIKAVQELLGHESVDTTRHYVGISMKTMRDAVEKI